MLDTQVQRQKQYCDELREIQSPKLEAAKVVLEILQEIERQEYENYLDVVMAISCNSGS